jgi:hypothetical protein
LADSKIRKKKKSNFHNTENEQTPKTNTRQEKKERFPKKLIGNKMSGGSHNILISNLNGY